MDFEFNPFRLLIPPGGEPIRSIDITSNIDWFDVPSSITGQNAIMPLNVRDDILALKVFATGSAAGSPIMRSLVSAHIPQLEISKINGLQAALNSLVKSIASGNSTALSITNNGVGDYLVTPNFGQIANKFAQGNDNRFPSSVTGIRKGHGAGSLDTAAIVKVDYWNTALFSPSGASLEPDAVDGRGLVPDPGNVAGTTRFLCEDGTWKANSGSVTSVGLSMPSIFSVSGSPVTSSGTFTVTLAPEAPRTFFAGPAPADDDPTLHPPMFREIGFRDIQSFVGTDVNTICRGSDGRLSADVDGLRKGTGAARNDIPAVRFVDYWDNTVFVSRGPSHKIGLVPDPGTGSGPPRFLRDDSTWQPVVVNTGELTNSMLAAMPANTLKANATGSTASPTDVTAKDARSSLLLNLESITTFGNVDYTIPPTGRYIATTATFTTSRTVTLPLANTLNPGQPITISDDFGAINGAFVLKVQRQGSDLIQGSSTAFNLDTPMGSVTLTSDGVSKWSVVGRSPSIVQRYYVSNAIYTTPTGAKALLVECIGGGGGGGGAVASASNASAAGGGASGGYARTWINSPVLSYTMTIGTGGAGGTSGSNGSSGTATSFGSACIGDLGQGGIAMAGGNTIAFSNGGISGSGTGDFTVRGSDGGKGMRLSGTAGLSGSGMAPPVFGAVRQGTSIELSGSNAFAYGSGGAGALSLSASGQTGGIGSQGIIIVTEYY